MSHASDNKPARKESFLSKVTGIFRKKKKEKTPSRSPSQGQTNSQASSTEGQSSGGTFKILGDDTGEKGISAGATSVSQTCSVTSIDLANVSTAANGSGDNKQANLSSEIREERRNEAANGEVNGGKSKRETNEDSSGNVCNETRRSVRNKSPVKEGENSAALNEDISVIKWKTNEAGNPILINQLDKNTNIDLATGKVVTTETEVSVKETNEDKSASELMKRKWFAEESVSKSNSVDTTPDKTERIENLLIFESGLMEKMIPAPVDIPVPSVLEEEYVKLEWPEKDSTKEKSQMLIDIEKEEKKLEEEYFTTGKYASYFLLAIERQYYDPTQVYSMVRYHDAEDSDDSDQEVGENSSPESTSPNTPAALRRRLLHRRSADNLIVNSPTNSMRHSSPESVKSAPVQLKPRSTSHDALSKRKDKQASQADGVSMDSLAKQSLLAAHVLNLIPAQKARDRNFLHGRIAANSLLGPVELEKVLPNREIKIFVGTWNMNGQTPPKELNDFMLPSGLETIPDMLAIGTQESCSEKSEWEAALQETLGPSHVLLTSTSLGTLHLALFVRRDLIWFCSVPEDSYFSTRPGTAFRTKGAVALAIMLFGTSFLFVTAHLTAHQDKVKERIHDIKRIVRNLDLPKDLPTRHRSKDVTQNFDCVFWCGDLNFRLSQPREEVVQWITNTRFPQESPIDLHSDQLRTALKEGAVLKGFQEAAIMFPPTFKYDPGTQNFDSSSKQRAPAYTDRILFKGKDHSRDYIQMATCDHANQQKDGTLECLVYDSVPSICTSDHKPVWGVFKTTLRPGIDTIPLAAGLFNREIYLEGIKRRAAAMDDSPGTSRVCSIQ